MELPKAGAEALRRLAKERGIHPWELVHNLLMELDGQPPPPPVEPLPPAVHAIAQEAQAFLWERGDHPKAGKAMGRAWRQALALARLDLREPVE